MGRQMAEWMDGGMGSLENVRGEGVNYWVIGLCFDRNDGGNWCSGVGWAVSAFEV